MRLLRLLRRASHTALLTAGLAALAVAAPAAEDIGKSLAVIDQATASGEVGDRTLVVGEGVYLGDVVATDGQGEAQLLFNDGTRMVVGPNSQLMLDEFVFRGSAAENKFAVRALGGAFRFITGDGPSEAYEIHTPSGTMGIRGTSFDFSVTAQETKVLLYRGGVTLCGTTACADADVEERAK